MIERTLILVKPDGVQRGLVGEVLKRFEQRGLKIVGMKMVWADEDTASNHYTEDISERHGEKIRQNLLEYITEGPVVAAVIEGAHAVETVRKLVGDTEPKSSSPGTIRGDYAHQSYSVADSSDVAVMNIIHASATPEEAEQELAVWFSDDEVHSYKRVDEKQHFGSA